MGVKRSVLVAALVSIGLSGAVSAQSADDGVLIGIEPSDDVSNDGTVPGGTTEYTGRDKVIRALFERQERLEEAILVLQQRIIDVNALATSTDDLIRRGQEPLVSLEIDQLSKQIDILVQENALLRETLGSAGIVIPSIEESRQVGSDG